MAPVTAGLAFDRLWSCDLALEPVHKVAPGAHCRTNAQGRVVRDTPCKLFRHPDVLALRANAGDHAGLVRLLGGEKPSGQRHFGGECSRSAEVSQAPISRTAEAARRLGDLELRSSLRQHELAFQNDPDR